MWKPFNGRKDAALIAQQISAAVDESELAAADVLAAAQRFEEALARYSRAATRVGEICRLAVTGEEPPSRNVM